MRDLRASRVEDHPRPQLVRDRWIDLSGTWDFAYDDADVGLREGWVERPEVFDRTIRVPFPPESEASTVGDPGPHPVLWYRRRFAVPGADREQRLLLHFGAVDYRAGVWVNGSRVGEHEGGHTPFTLDITGALVDGDEQVVVVRAEDHPSDLTQPRGKQYWSSPPEEIWYHRTSGIWQPVWLEPVPWTSIAEVRWTPDVDGQRVGVQVTVAPPTHRPLRLRLSLRLRGTVLAHDTYPFTGSLEGTTLRREVNVAAEIPSVQRRRFLWSPEAPNLIDAELQLLDGEEVLDSVRSYLGLRSVSVSDGRMLLNGLPYYLRMVLSQGYWPASHLASPDPEALRREVEGIKALGFNGVRVHQKIEDPRFLYWCDRLGLVVWTEMPSTYVFSASSVDRLVREWLEVLQRDYNHPCIVTWVPFNESWGLPALARSLTQQAYVRALYFLTHAADGTRPVIGNDGWEHMASDVWGIHDYTTRGEVLRERYGTTEAVDRTIREVQPNHRRIGLGERVRGEPIMLTEFGGISFPRDPAAPWFGYGTVRDPETFVAKYAELVGAVTDSPAIAGFCYTQLCDTEQETNGLLTADRRPKADPGRIHAITRRLSPAVPGEEILAHIDSAADVSPGRDQFIDAEDRPLPRR